MKVLLLTIVIIISIIYLFNFSISEGFTQEETDQKKESVNKVLHQNNEISTKTTCDINKGGVCYIDGMPKRIVDTVIANIQEDEYYKKVFKNIRSYNTSNIYDCVDKINPLLSVVPLKKWIHFNY